VSSLEQTLLFAATTLVLAGTLVAFIVQYIRHNGKHRD